MTHPVIGMLAPLSGLLHIVLEPTDFEYFRTPTIHGIARVTDGLEFLAIESLYPGQGHFKRFLDSCEYHYPRVTVWGINNPMLDNYLHTRHYQAVRDEEGNEGRRWPEVVAYGQGGC